MVGGVFLAYQMMCDGCPNVNIEAVLKLKHCKECIKKEEFKKTYRVMKYR